MKANIFELNSAADVVDFVKKVKTDNRISENKEFEIGVPNGSS